MRVSQTGRIFVRANIRQVADVECVGLAQVFPVAADTDAQLSKEVQGVFIADAESVPVDRYSVIEGATDLGGVSNGMEGVRRCSDTDAGRARGGGICHYKGYLIRRERIGGTARLALTGVGASEKFLFCSFSAPPGPDYPPANQWVCAGKACGTLAEDRQGLCFGIPASSKFGYHLGTVQAGKPMTVRSDGDITKAVLAHGLGGFVVSDQTARG